MESSINPPIQPSNDPSFALLADLRPDPAQPRKSFPDAEQTALRESIQANGIQEALVVRADPAQKTKWMIVEGERRWRVAGELKAVWVPIHVRDFKDDAEVRSFQRIVGTQRLNLNALELAADLDRELKARQAVNPKFSVRDLAAALGLAPATTYENLKLLKISPPVRVALESGRLDASKARLFATVPAAEHAKLLKEAFHTDWAGELSHSVRSLTKHIEENYSRQLNGAPWKLEDADVLKSAGPCSSCPKRSGNIEGMDGNPNICTDVECYDKKQTAHAVRTLSEAKAQNKRVIPSEEYARKRYSGFELATEKPYEAQAKGKTFAQLAKAANIEPAITVDEKGHAVEVFTTADVAVIKKAAGIKKHSYRNGSDVKATQAYQKKKKQFLAAANAATAQILENQVQSPTHSPCLSPALWKLICWGAYHALDIQRHDFVAKRRGLARVIGEARDGLKGWIEKTTDGRELARMTVELLVCASWDDGGWQTCKWSKEFEAAAKLAGVNLDKLLSAPSAVKPDGVQRKGRKGPDAKDAKKTKPKGKRK